MNELSAKIIEQALTELGENLDFARLGPYELVVCGGAALISCALVPRLTTRDVDVLALKDSTGLLTPDPLPTELLQEAEKVRVNWDLPENWMNNGPSRHPGGLFQVGLPEGLEDRLTERRFGARLTVHFISRLDQIFFKVFASVDSGPGRHVEDLQNLSPTADEIERAAQWAQTHDPSDGFKMMMRSMIAQMGFNDVAERI